MLVGRADVGEHLTNSHGWMFRLQAALEGGCCLCTAGWRGSGAMHWKAVKKSVVVVGVIHIS